jgi:uncharacterized membrane protein
MYLNFLYLYRNSFLSVFAKLRKVIIRFAVSVYLSVCLSVCLSFHPSAWNNSATNGRIFMKFDAGAFFENLWRKFALHSDKNNGHFS